jgi:3-methyladenine DNA glycosylase AlkD
MARYGITAEKVIGVPAPFMHKLARSIGKNHALAEQLWATGVYDARILAALIDDANLVTRRQMELWAADFNNWAICDCCCIYLFVYTPYAKGKALAWSRRKKEYVKRAGFTLMASQAVHDKYASNDLFKTYLSVIEREAYDERNAVKKAVNWALRQIGKRNKLLNTCAIRTSGKLKQFDSRSARWIASDALKELSSNAVQLRLLKQNRI